MPNLGVFFFLWVPGILYLSAEQRKTLRDSPEPWIYTELEGRDVGQNICKNHSFSSWNGYLSQIKAISNNFETHFPFLGTF